MSEGCGQMVLSCQQLRSLRDVGFEVPKNQLSTFSVKGRQKRLSTINFNCVFYCYYHGYICPRNSKFCDKNILLFIPLHFPYPGKALNLPSGKKKPRSPKLNLHYRSQEDDSLPGALPVFRRSPNWPTIWSKEELHSNMPSLLHRLMCPGSKLFLDDLMYRRKQLNVSKWFPAVPYEAPEPL